MFIPKQKRRPSATSAARRDKRPFFAPNKTQHIQPKLKVGAANDVYEQEADRVADQVMAMQAPMSVATSSLSPQVQRLCPECEDELQRQPVEEKEEEEESGEEFVQAKAQNGGPVLSHMAASRVHALKGGGQPLPASTQAFFTPRFGSDFSQVRIHTDARAQQAAQTVKARAFTLGRDIVFNSGQYQPHSLEGRRLIAHELTHTLQQTGPGMLQRAPEEEEAAASPPSAPAPPTAAAPPLTLQQQYQQDCRGVRLLQRLTRNSPIMLAEKLRRLEDRRTFIRYYFRSYPSLDPIQQQAFQCAVDCIFGRGVVLLSEAGELARVQCAMNEARRQDQVLRQRRTIPGQGRRLRRRVNGLDWIADPRLCFNATRLQTYLENLQTRGNCTGR